jgi:hypothetical protein
MAYKPVKVPEKEISSRDIKNFGGGLFLQGAQIAPENCFINSKDAELDLYGFLIPRRRQTPFLPDTVETSYQKFPVLWDGEIYFFTLDDGKVKYCQEGDAAWVDCTGDNTFTTLNGGFPKLIRVDDSVMILNGKNGDKLAYVDLRVAGFPAVKYALVANPTLAPTFALTNLAAGAHHIYYAYSYDGAVGSTELSPILDTTINNTRDLWATQTSKGSIKITRPGTVPTGARYWTLHIAVAATAGAIQPSDMLQLAVKLDLATTEFIDDGTLSINLSSVAPTTNSTDGPRVSHGVITDGRPVLFGDEDNFYNIWIGAGGPNAKSFSASDGGYRAEPEKGTNYYPTSIVGFRTGQGNPALTVLFSNTEGLSKQAVLQQQTINYGDQTFTVWGVTEQHYGAAGVAAPNSAINYNGKLMFFSTDGVMSMESKPTTPNVLDTKPISSPIDDLIRSIKNSAMPAIVGAGWNNKYMWLVPNAGFDTPQQILILDTNVKGVNGDGAWLTMDIKADWIGVISPQDDPAFVYISRGNQTFKLQTADSTYDTIDGASVPFSTGASGPLVGMGGEAHNTWQADVQTMFYIIGLVGEMTIGVRYRNQNGKLKTKTRKIIGPSFTPSSSGGYGDTEWGYSNDTPTLAESATIDDQTGLLTAIDIRKPVRVDDIMNEAQWFYETPVGYNNYKVRAISFEGINLGVRPDLQ